MYRKYETPSPEMPDSEITVSKPVMYIVDDDENMADFIAYAAEAVGYDVKILLSAQALQDIWEVQAPDIIVMDIIMPQVDGIELMSWLAEKRCQTPMVLMSGFDVRHIESAAHLANALRINVVETFQKPIALVNLESLFRKLNENLFIEEQPV